MKRKKREVIQALQACYEAPASVERDRFLKEIAARHLGENAGKDTAEGAAVRDGNGTGSGSESLSLGGFLAAQAGYIRKWNWALAAAIFLLALVVTRAWGSFSVWVLSSCVPLLALSTVSEGSRSVRFGMDELEQSALFSLKTVVLARLGILGIGNLVLVGLALPLLVGLGAGGDSGAGESGGRMMAGMAGGTGADMGFVSAALCLLLPYLLTTFLGLQISRRLRGPEGGWLCGALTALICVGNLLLGMVAENMTATWTGVTAGAAGMAETAVAVNMTALMRLTFWLHQSDVMAVLSAALLALACRECGKIAKGDLTYEGRQGR